MNVGKILTRHVGGKAADWGVHGNCQSHGGCVKLSSLWMDILFKWIMLNIANPVVVQVGDGPLEEETSSDRLHLLPTMLLWEQL